MASGNTGILAIPIRGPYLKHAFAKSVHKGEDAWLQQRDLAVPLPHGKGARTEPSDYKCMPGARCTLSFTQSACAMYNMHALCESLCMHAIYQSFCKRPQLILLERPQRSISQLCRCGKHRPVRHI